ncbi:MAG TPA: DUF1259 domain-containing protein [Gemmatimonadaceae bacterium]|nr:DUF1259 domain-containing protein [Gemmatimonadaceae bacterium]
MRNYHTLTSSALFVFLTAAPIAARAQASDSWAAVDDALGRKGAAQPSNVMKYGFPRSDLSVVVDGVTLKPALALGSWAAFRMIGKSRALVTGDLVLLETEVTPVMRALQAGGIEQTALHNHVLNESPRVMYMHIMGMGDPAKLARTIHDGLAKSETPLAAPAPGAPPASVDLDTAAIAKALGVHGKLNGVVYQVSVPRRDRITEDGYEVTPAMGVATAINFQPTGGGKAAITGDFVLRASEVNPVIRALTQHGIAVTALHSHMLTESPHLFFMHFWANDDAVTLATGLHAALAATASKM